MPNIWGCSYIVIPYSSDSVAYSSTLLLFISHSLISVLFVLHFWQPHPHSSSVMTALIKSSVWTMWWVGGQSFLLLYATCNSAVLLYKVCKRFMNHFIMVLTWRQSFSSVQKASLSSWAWFPGNACMQLSEKLPKMLLILHVLPKQHQPAKALTPWRWRFLAPRRWQQILQIGYGQLWIKLVGPANPTDA